MEIPKQLEGLDWHRITTGLHDKGFATVRNVITTRDCNQLIEEYDNVQRYRKTIKMERYRFGRGEYKYYSYPLPDLIEQLRKNIYPYLAPVANQWMSELKIDTHFPDTFGAMKKLCSDNGQTKPTALILKYGPGGFNTLHQDLYGQVYFPLQIVLMLSDPEKEYTGGEFVITEQIPRAQSKGNVIIPQKGDMLIFTTNFRPVKGSKGYYRVNMKHGVSPLRTGERYSLGIIFHDALT